VKGDAMSMRKKAVIPAVFLACMVLLTFFSKTIYRGLLPNVEVIAPRGGSMRFTYHAQEYRLGGDEASAVYLAYGLPEALMIDRIYARVNETVTEGAPLVRFYEPAAMELLAGIRRKRDEAGVQWRVWQDDYAWALDSAEGKVKNAKSITDKQTAERELAQLREGIMNDASLDLMFGAYNGYCLLADALESLREEDWTVYAPHAGIISEICVDIADHYSGIYPMLRIYPALSQPVILVEWPSLPAQYALNWRLAAVITDRHGRVDGTPLYIDKPSSGSATVTIQPNGSCDYSTISQVSIVLDTPYYPVLVPNSVLDGGDCFLLAERAGAWGQKEYYAKKVSLSLGASNGINTAVLSGLDANDAVIVSSNTVLENGRTVVVK
jgi:hypothetical protein